MPPLDAMTSRYIGRFRSMGGGGVMGTLTRRERERERERERRGKQNKYFFAFHDFTFIM